MPPPQSVRRDRSREYGDDVDEYIASRRPPGARDVDSWLDPRLTSIIDRVPESPPPADPAEDRDTAGAAPDRTPIDSPSGRRTIVITGRGSERHLPARRTYSSSLRPHERSGFKPDRLAMWAFLLGLALLLGAATSSHAAVFHSALLHHLAR